MSGTMKEKLDRWCVAINKWLDTPMRPPEEPKHACRCGGHCHKPKPLTREQQVILSAWQQWAYRVDGACPGYHTGGLAALEEIEAYLLDNDLIDSFGNPKEAKQ